MHETTTQYGTTTKWTRPDPTSGLNKQTKNV